MVEKKRARRFEGSLARQWERWLSCHGVSDPENLEPAREAELREEFRARRVQILSNPGYLLPANTREIVPGVGSRPMNALSS